MKKMHFLLSFLAFFLLFPPLALTTLAAEPANLLMILDASGSMWGRIDGQPKITTAKTAAANAISALPDTVATGVMFYGHRRKGDCQDIELAAPLGTARSEILSRLTDINAKGKTPLTTSLVQAGDMLAAKEGESTILLISDGIETCGGDPCAAVAAMRQKGVKLVVHVIGFDVRDKAVEQLQCIAQAGGGSYFQANDTSGLQKALQSVQAAVVEHKTPAPVPTPPPVQAAAAPAEQTSSSKRVRIAGPGTVIIEPAPWVKTPPQHWALAEAESGERRAEGAGLQTSVKEGEYQVIWKQSEHGHTEVPLTATIQVQSGQTTKVAIDTGIKPVTPTGVLPPHWWGLMPAEEAFDPGANTSPVIRFRDTLEPQVTPAGRYRLLWRQGEHYSQTQDMGIITIESGRLNEIPVDSGLALQPADWVTKEPYYYALLDASGKKAGRWNSYGPQLAAPGHYTLVFRPTEHSNEDIIWSELDIPAHGIQAVPINSGLRFLVAKDAPPPYRVFLVNLATNKEIVMKQSWGPLPLPPGRYRLDWRQTEHDHGKVRSTLAEEIVVEPGVLLEVEM